MSRCGLVYVGILNLDSESDRFTSAWLEQNVIQQARMIRQLSTTHEHEFETANAVISKHAKFLQSIRLKCGEDTIFDDIFRSLPTPSSLRILELREAKLTADQLLSIALSNPHLEELSYSHFDRSSHFTESFVERRTAWIRAGATGLPKLQYLSAPIRADTELPLICSSFPHLCGLHLISEFEMSDGTPAPDDYDWGYYEDTDPPRRVGELNVDITSGGTFSPEAVATLKARVPVGVGLNVLADSTSVLSEMIKRRACDAILQLREHGFRFNDPFALRYEDHPFRQILEATWQASVSSNLKCLRALLESGVDPIGANAAGARWRTLWLEFAGCASDDATLLSSKSSDLFRFVFDECTDAYVGKKRNQRSFADTSLSSGRYRLVFKRCTLIWTLIRLLFTRSVERQFCTALLRFTRIRSMVTRARSRIC